MSQNPYLPGVALPQKPTRATRWLVLCGTGVLIVAAVCLLATVAGMIWAFNRVANAGTTPNPSELAKGISMAMIPVYAAVPLGILGIALVIMGVFRRQPPPTQNDRSAKS